MLTSCVPSFTFQLSLSEAFKHRLQIWNQKKAEELSYYCTERQGTKAQRGTTWKTF